LTGGARSEPLGAGRPLVSPHSFSKNLRGLTHRNAGASYCTILAGMPARAFAMRDLIHRRDELPFKVDRRCSDPESALWLC